MPVSDALLAHLEDLKNKCEMWHKPQASQFFNEEEQAEIIKKYAPSKFIRYDGGYENARKKKVIFLFDEEDDFSDVVCLEARIDQRFRNIGHRDILGALMSLQIDRGSFGDFWVQDDKIYLYTSKSMSPFLIDNLTRINQLSVTFKECDDKPSQEFKYKDIEVVVASERLDAIVAGITHLSRAKAKELITSNLVQINHMVVEEPEILCHNNNIISIRGYGRFVYAGVKKETRHDRKLILLKQSI